MNARLSVSTALFGLLAVSGFTARVHATTVSIEYAAHAARRLTAAFGATGHEVVSAARAAAFPIRFILAPKALAPESFAIVARRHGGTRQQARNGRH